MGKRIVGKRFTPDAKDQQDMLVRRPSILHPRPRYLLQPQGSFIRHGLTQRQCETEALVQIVAGSDTTATTIRATLLYLLSTPRAYRALQAEIDAGIASGAISTPVSNAEANELPYLQGVILEGLRLHPPFTGLPFKVVPPEGDVMDGRRVPGGTLVAPNFAATGRHRGTFGADADVFRPERWIEAEPEKRGEMRRVAEMVFGYGRWGCAGKMIAFLELNKVFVEVSRLLDPLPPLCVSFLSPSLPRVGFKGGLSLTIRAICSSSAISTSSWSTPPSRGRASTTICICSATCGWRSRCGRARVEYDRGVVAPWTNIRNDSTPIFPLFSIVEERESHVRLSSVDVNGHGNENDNGDDNGDINENDNGDDNGDVNENDNGDGNGDVNGNSEGDSGKSRCGIISF